MFPFDLCVATWHQHPIAVVTLKKEDEEIKLRLRGYEKIVASVYVHGTKINFRIAKEGRAALRRWSLDFGISESELVIRLLGLELCRRYMFRLSSLNAFRKAFDEFFIDRFPVLEKDIINDFLWRSLCEVPSHVH